jgi:hypothetical protein
MQALPPQSLVFVQTTLEQVLPDQWKGKVVSKVGLKIREEAPPCPACGLDLQEEFVDVLEHYKCYMASEGREYGHCAGQTSRSR